MGKIPRQPGGSGGWPDHRRSSTYRSKHAQKKGCPLLLIYMAGIISAIAYAGTLLFT